MQTTCRIYRNSGFNAVNIPDSPALLDTINNFVDCYALDLNQERFLPTVKIRGDWLSCKDCDYCKVGDFYYFVDNVQMLSGDVAELTLTPDFITSAGGPAALDILDGVTDRVHVTDDSYGLYGADDPYMAPALDMDIQSFVKSFNDGNSLTFVETTLNLSAIYDKISNNNLNAFCCKDSQNPDPDGNYPYVVVPDVDYQDDSTEYYCGVGGISLRLANTKNQAIYNIDDTANSLPYQRAIAYARALGIEESISGQYEIPAQLLANGSSINPSRISTLRGHVGNYNATIPFVFGTANNKRIFYGSHTPYTIVTASGSSMSAKAEEIYHSGLTYPYVTVAVDPRRTGKPYYRFRYLNGIDGDSSLDFFRGCVAGKEWLNHPLVFNNKGGSLLDQINYQNSRYMTDLDALHTSENFKAASLESGFGMLANAGGDLISGGAAGAGSAISTAVNAGIAQYERNRALGQYADKYRAQKVMDEQQLQISQKVFVPEVHFPVSPDLFAEATGNGFLVARPVYKSADISRIDKILTAYGYKYAKVLEASDFNNRTYFNYVSGSISVGSLPRWWADGISAQIGAGVRVWHVKPNHSYYSSNPVRV